MQSAAELCTLGSIAYEQIFNMAHLFRGRFTGNSNAPGLSNGIVEALVAGMGIVVLLAAVVGLDHYVVCFRPQIARAAKLAVKGCGDMVQERAEGHSQSSFRIYSCAHVQYSAPLLLGTRSVSLVHVLPARAGRPAEAQFANGLEGDRVCMQRCKPGPRLLQLLLIDSDTDTIATAAAAAATDR